MDSEASLLVVDDSEANRDMLSRRLKGKGYAVTVAEGGRQALDLVARHRYDLILLDIVMPDINGLEVLQTLRRTWSAADLPVIIATARDESGDVVEGLKVGANDYVTKPLDLPVVLARVQTQLSLKRAVDQIKRLEEDLEQRNEALEDSNSKLEFVNRELALANQRMERDLRSAVRIQESLLPTSLPDGPDARFAWLLKPCAELAGDTLNVFRLDDDHVGMYVLDVVGHGVEAALLSVAVSRVLSPAPDSFLMRRAEGSPHRRFLSPAEVAVQLDRYFPWDRATQQFFTLLYGVLNLRTREWRYVSPGHPPPILLARNAEAPRVLASASELPIGLGEAGYQEQVVALQPGDRLYLYSDGIPEAVNGEGEPFFVPRLLEALANGRSRPLADSVSALWHAIEIWCGGAELADDASLLAVEIPE
ncbi:MAG: SpoIIE family protein phosphatase [Betaproteobacteria bacterium]|nr:SpoIIE family protein phosphatase [Betaproteobacteria bacterium]